MLWNARTTFWEIDKWNETEKWNGSVKWINETGSCLVDELYVDFSFDFMCQFLPPRMMFWSWFLRFLGVSLLQLPSGQVVSGYYQKYRIYTSKYGCCVRSARIVHFSILIKTVCWRTFPAAFYSNDDYRLRDFSYYSAKPVNPLIQRLLAGRRSSFSFFPNFLQSEIVYGATFFLWCCHLLTFTQKLCLQLVTTPSFQRCHEDFAICETG